MPYHFYPPGLQWLVNNCVGTKWIFLITYIIEIIFYMFLSIYPWGQMKDEISRAKMISVWYIESGCLYIHEQWDNRGSRRLRFTTNFYKYEFCLFIPLRNKMPSKHINVFIFAYSCHAFASSSIVPHTHK